MPKQRYKNIRDDRKAYRFALSVPANTSGKLVLDVPSNCTLEKVKCRIYFGAQLALRLKPYIMRPRKTKEEILCYVAGGKDYIDGDDDGFEFDVAIPLWLDDQIVVEYNNTDANYAYDFAIDVELDSRFGVERWPGIYPEMVGGGR